MGEIVSRRHILTGLGTASILPIVQGRSFGAEPAPRSGHGEEADGRDPVFEQITRELGLIHTEVAATGRRRDALHNFGSQLRLAAAHAKSVGLDMRITRAVATAIDSRGRDAILSKPDIDPRQYASLLRPFGFAVLRAPVVPTLDHRQKSDALNDLAMNGITAQLGRQAAAVTAAELAMERRADTNFPGGGHIVTAQCEGFEMMAGITAWAGWMMFGIDAYDSAMCEIAAGYLLAALDICSLIGG